MRRLLRWAFNGAAAVSGVLIVATCLMWFRSYRFENGLAWVHDRPQRNRLIQIRLSAISIRGGICLAFVHHDATTEASIVNLLTYHQWHPIFYRWSDRVDDVDAIFSEYVHERKSYLFSPTRPSPLGFQFDRRTGDYQGNHYWNAELSIPCWLPVIMFTVFPLGRIHAGRKGWERGRQGRCPSCGYDLRATPARCPECGAVPVPGLKTGT